MKGKLVRSEEGKRLNVLGDNQLIKLTANETNGQLTTIIQNNPPGTSIPKHVHSNEDEVFKLIEGEVEFEIGEEKITLKRGDMIFLPRNVPHSFRVVGTKNAIVNLDIIPGGLENMFEELSQLPQGPPDFAKVAEICGRYGLKFV